MHDQTLIWLPEHAPKPTKFGTQVKSGENFEKIKKKAQVWYIKSEIPYIHLEKLLFEVL